MQAHDEVAWLNFEKAKSQISEMIDEKRAPLVWFKNKVGQVSVGFIVWW